MSGKQVFTPPWVPMRFWHMVFLLTKQTMNVSTWQAMDPDQRAKHQNLGFEWVGAEIPPSGKYVDNRFQFYAGRCSNLPIWQGFLLHWCFQCIILLMGPEYCMVDIPQTAEPDLDRRDQVLGQSRTFSAWSWDFACINLVVMFFLVTRWEVLAGRCVMFPDWCTLWKMQRSRMVYNSSASFQNVRLQSFLEDVSGEMRTICMCADGANQVKYCAPRNSYQISKLLRPWFKTSKVFRFQYVLRIGVLDKAHEVLWWIIDAGHQGLH